MTPCNKELNILTDFRGEEIALTVYCVDSEYHEGKHQWQIWIGMENKLQPNGKVMIKVIY